MRVLLDTCVLSELHRKGCRATVRAAVARLAEEDLFVSVITIGEIAKGVALLRPGRKKESLTDWLHELELRAAERILPIEPETARIWGQVTAEAQQQGKTVSAADGLIAATALRHGLAVMTRNTQDFLATGVRLVNPWEDE